MNQITSQTLSFYRENRNRTDCEARKIVESALALLTGKIHASGVKVETQYHEGREELNSHEGELRQVFLNLISNALEATPPGGRLVVRTRASRDWARQGRRGVRVIFADSGSGMPPLGARESLRAVLYDEDGDGQWAGALGCAGSDREAGWDDTGLEQHDSRRFRNGVQCVFAIGGD